MNYTNDIWTQNFVPDYDQYGQTVVDNDFLDQAHTAAVNNDLTQHAQAHVKTRPPRPDVVTSLNESAQWHGTSVCETFNDSAFVIDPIAQTSPTVRSASTLDQPVASEHINFSYAGPIPGMGLADHRSEDAICMVSRLNDTDTKAFACQFPECGGRYTRWPDFLRHYDGAHAVEKKEIWCPSTQCDRGRPFPRKDKMMDHARKVHGLYIENGQS
ncbi:hypothetical protein BU25DRAFT_490721 [Macroventuria anomochaeta]|uniref:Uncharacterized protein n=1 Tax=Macroventuria anomochaeta TaxID=301207 RepID=A0ACB6S3U5_9PLEO|nr:uncharacterized protein BU25DRAFT_490721 [Macroventuria anomochaeta]KAF2628064.1 hypothetical protein BU25DRAFT_490721 [Macroventuria anomochaeta]